MKESGVELRRLNCMRKLMFVFILPMLFLYFRCEVGRVFACLVR